MPSQRHTVDDVTRTGSCINQSCQHQRAISKQRVPARACWTIAFRMSRLEQQLDNVRIIQSLFCLPGECELADETAACLSSGGDTTSKHDLELTLHLSLDGETDPILDISVTLDVSAEHNDGDVSELGWSAKIIKPSSLTQRQYADLVQRAEKELVQLKIDVSDDIPAQLMAWCDWLKVYMQDVQSERAVSIQDANVSSSPKTLV